MSILAALVLSFNAYATDPVLLKTGREIYASYVNILGIPGSDPDTTALFQQNIGRLPKAGTPNELSNNVVLAVTELGGLFCQKAVARESAIPAGQRNLFGSIDFSKDYSQFDDYTVGKFTEDLAMAFWQRDVKDAEKAALAKAIKTASPGPVDKIAQVVCTIYATSLPTLVR